MSDSLANKIMISLVRLEVKPKEYLIRSGEVPAYIYFVDSGLLEGINSEDVDRKCLGFWPGGSIVYYHRQLWNRISIEESLMALTPTVVYALPYESLLEIREIFPAFRNYIIGLLDISNAELEKKNRILAMRYPELKVAKFMEYYGFALPMIPANRLASFLCMSDATYFRVMSLQR